MTNLPFPYDSLSGGLNTFAAPFDIDDTKGQSPDLVNVLGTQSGAILKRPGTVEVFPAASAASNTLFGSDGFIPPVVFVAGSDTIYQVATNTHPWNSTAFVTGLTSGHRWEFLSAPTLAGAGSGVYVLGVNGVDTPRRLSLLTATTWANTSGAVAVPNGKYMAYHQNQVFMAGTTAFPTGSATGDDPGSRLYWSAIANPFNWDPASITGAGFVDLDPDDGYAISAIGTVGPYLLVCKPHKMWVLVDPATATVRKISDSIGCPAHRSIASTPGGTYFMSSDRGVYVTDGSKLSPISDVVLPSLTDPAGAVGVYHNAHYYLAQGSLVYDFDTILGAWWRHGVTAQDFTVFQDTLYAIDSIGNVVQMWSGTSDYAFWSGGVLQTGNAIPWHWFAPWQSPSFYRRRRFPTPYYKKRLRQIRAIGYGTVELTVAYDVGENVDMGPVVFSTSLFPGTSSLPAVAKVFGLGVAESFQLRFSGSDTNPAALYEYVMMMTDRVDQIPA